MDEGLLNKIQELIEKGVGDIPRLEDIKEKLEAGKKLYQSDQDYINEILSKYGLVETADKPKEETSKSSSEDKIVSEIKKELGTATEKIEEMEKKIEIQEKKTDSVKHYKSEGTTLVLSIVVGLLGIMGVGHIYLGRVRRGAIILIIGMIGWGGLFVPFVMLGMFSELEESSVDPTAMMGMFSELEESSVDPTAMMGMMAGFGVIVIVWGIGMFVLFIWQILNSRKLCKQYNEYFEEHGKPPW